MGVVVYAFTSIPGGLIEFNFFNVNLETISLCLAEETKIIGTTSWAGVPAALTISWAGVPAALTTSWAGVPAALTRSKLLFYS